MMLLLLTHYSKFIHEAAVFSASYCFTKSVREKSMLKNLQKKLGRLKPVLQASYKTKKELHFDSLDLYLFNLPLPESTGTSGFNSLTN